MAQSNDLSTRRNKHGSLLNFNERVDLLQFLAAYHSNREAQVFIRAHFNKQMAISSIQWYRGAKSPYRALLERYREDFDKTLLPIESKQVDLGRLADSRMVWKDGKLYVVSVPDAVDAPSESKARVVRQSPQRGKKHEKTITFLKRALGMS